MVLLRTSGLDRFRDPLTGHETLYCVSLVARREVRVPLYHAQCLPPTKRLYGEQIDALHGEPGSEGVPRVMEAKIFDLGGADSRWEALLGPPQVTLALSVREHERPPIQRPREPGEDLSD